MALGAVLLVWLTSERATSTKPPVDSPLVEVGSILFTGDVMTTSVRTELSGVWRSRGYGWLLEFRKGKPRVYDVAESFCMEQRRGSTELNDLGRTAAFSNNGQTIHLTSDDSNYAYTFDKIDALPAQCLSKPADHPVAVFDALVEIFNTHYAFFSVRDVDWARVVEMHRNQVNNDLSDKELFKIIKSLLSNINDGHVTLTARINGTQRSFDAGRPRASDRLKRFKLDRKASNKASYWMRGIGEKLVDDDVETGAGKAIRFGLIDEEIGVLSIRSMSGGGRKAIDNAMDRAMELFEDARAVIIDVSMNGGGDDAFARRIASRFVAERTLGYYKYAGDGEGERPQPIYIEPGKGKRYTGPIFLITSHKTASAAEIFTLALRALPNVTHVGDATEGILSDMLEKRLPNGWRLSLSNEVYLDVRKTLWEGKGIQPDIFADVRKRKKAKDKHKLAARQFVDRILSR